MYISRGRYLFEVSWEVCNKVGGIHTVVTSKASCTKKLFEHYICVGPYFEKNAREHLDSITPPEFLRKAFDTLSQEGIRCIFGTWKIPGSPFVILIDFSKVHHWIPSVKTLLWDWHGIDSLFSRWDFEEPIIWSWCVGKLVEEVQKVVTTPLIMQCHEWMSGTAILYTKKKNLPIATVFTTHATMLGRSIAGNNRELYGCLKKINPLEEARSLNVHDKFLVERACAKTADVFTTVSAITALEAEMLLGRVPEVLTLNGLDDAIFPDATNERVSENRDRLRSFVRQFFFPYYKFNIDKTILFYTSGRYEFSNKGVDIFIESLSIVNKRLQDEKSDITIVAFFFVLAGSFRPRQELVDNKTNIHEEKRGGTPPLTAYLIDEVNDPTIKACRAHGLNNTKNDRVKIVFYPAMLDKNESLLHLDYYDVAMGCDLGVFPSYYEPWGYTPMESVAVRVPTITTDLAGYGRYMKGRCESIIVIDREKKRREESIRMVAEEMYKFIHLDSKEKERLRQETKKATKKTDWKELIKNYEKSYDLAFGRIGR